MEAELVSFYSVICPRADDTVHDTFLEDERRTSYFGIDGSRGI